MGKNLLIIYRGWSSTKSLYKSIGKLYNGWDICYDDEVLNIDVDGYQKVAIFAWSMGTLDAIEFEMKNKVDEMILVSPTIDFTLTTRSIILKKMIKRLGHDKSECLEDFTRLCFDDELEAIKYWDEYRGEILELDTKLLIEGLNKLIDKKIEPLKREISPLIIIGSNDKVIPGKNSQTVIDMYTNAKVYKENGGHNLFYSKQSKLLEVIKKYQKFT